MPTISPQSPRPQSSGSKAARWQGGCHCGRVRFEFAASLAPILECNCSICTQKGYLHLIIPKSAFFLLNGEDDLSCYTFGTHTAKHLFCRHCGVASFYIPRSHPDSIDINVRCLDDFNPKVHKVTIYFDGKNWEEALLSLKKASNP